MSIVQTAFNWVMLQETPPAIIVYENMLKIVARRNIAPDIAGSHVSRETRNISPGFRAWMIKITAAETATDNEW